MQDDNHDVRPAPPSRRRRIDPAPSQPAAESPPGQPELGHQQSPDCPRLHPLFSPGGVSIISGATGIGKTALIAGWIKRILEGKTLFKIPMTTQPTAIAVIVTDRTRGNTTYWFEQAGIMDRVRLYCLQSDFTVEWLRFRKAEQHPKLFTEAVEKFGTLPPGTLLFVDPISVYLGGKLSDYGHTAAALGPLGKLAAQRGFTVIGTHHVPKASKDPKDKKLRPQDRVLGSTAIAAYTNTQFYVVGPEELGDDKHPATHYEIGYVAHEHPSGSYRFKRGGDGLFTPWDQRLRTVVEGNVEVRTPEDEKLDRMRSVLPEDKVVAVTYLVATMDQQFKIKKTQVYEHLKELMAMGEVEKVGTGQVRKVKMN